MSMVGALLYIDYFLHDLGNARLLRAFRAQGLSGPVRLKGVLDIGITWPYLHYVKTNTTLFEHLHDPGCVRAALAFCFHAGIHIFRPAYVMLCLVLFVTDWLVEMMDIHETIGLGRWFDRRVTLTRITVQATAHDAASACSRPGCWPWCSISSRHFGQIIPPGPTPASLHFAQDLSGVLLSVAGMPW